MNPTFYCVKGLGFPYFSFVGSSGKHRYFNYECYYLMAKIDNEWYSVSDRGEMFYSNNDEDCRLWDSAIENGTYVPVPWPARWPKPFLVLD